MRRRDLAVIGTAAFVAVGVGSGATAASLITGASIKDGTVTGRDLKNGSVTGRDIKDGSVGPVDLTRSARRLLIGTASTGSQGARGPAGPQGPQGAQGAAGRDGLDGLTGSTGAQGLKGEKGDRGPIGTLEWKGDWKSDIYQEGDIVHNGGSTYRCAPAPATTCTASDTPSASSDVWDLVAARGEQGIPGIPGKDGSDAQTFRWKEAWKPGLVPYTLGDVVSEAGSAWIVHTPHSSTPETRPGTTGGAEYWDMLVSKGATGPQGDPGPAGTLNLQYPSPVSVPNAANSADAGTAPCPGALHAIGGGVSLTTSLQVLEASYPSGTTGWSARVRNTDATNATTFTVYVVCAEGTVTQ